jgi:hypothetical protein
MQIDSSAGIPPLNSTPRFLDSQKDRKYWTSYSTALRSSKTLHATSSRPATKPPFWRQSKIVTTPNLTATRTVNMYWCVVPPCWSSGDESKDSSGVASMRKLWLGWTRSQQQLRTCSSKRRRCRNLRRASSNLVSAESRSCKHWARSQRPCWRVPRRRRSGSANTHTKTETMPLNNKMEKEARDETAVRMEVA